MIVVKQDPRFADAEDEDEYQATRLNPIIRDVKTCRLKDQEVESSDLVKFEPPLYIQRYAKVVEYCKTERFKNVADFGTAELTFVQYLKNLDFVNQIFAVDIDRGLLNSHKHRCKPLMFDHLNKRSEPLNISVLCGSVLEYDSRLYDLDCVSAIELIEHLPADDVSAFSDNLFGRLQPKHVVITTPNKDFNVLFEFEPGQMRHWDHKFEWTREEFARYCESVTSQHAYTYNLFGVGDPPAQHESVGPCSQGAVFTRRAAQLATSADTTSCAYEMVYSVDYPVADKSHTPDYHLTNELLYLCNRLGQDEYHMEGDEVSVISIPHLQTFPSIDQYRVSDAHIAQLARATDQLQVLEDGLSILVCNVPDSPEPSESDLSEEADFAADSNLDDIEVEVEW